MVPIRNLSGKVVGFGGAYYRATIRQSILIPRKPLFIRRGAFFSNGRRQNEIRSKNEAIVVEGYFDLVSLYQAGIKNVVAVSGTGFTVEQAALLARFCQRVVLLFDSDSAGVRAAFRACGVLYNSGLDPIGEASAGFDPDNFVRERGRDELSKVISGAVDIIDFMKAD